MALGKSGLESLTVRPMTPRKGSSGGGRTFLSSDEAGCCGAPASNATTIDIQIQGLLSGPVVLVLTMSPLSHLTLNRRWTDVFRRWTDVFGPPQCRPGQHLRPWLVDLSDLGPIRAGQAVSVSAVPDFPKESLEVLTDDRVEKGGFAVAGLIQSVGMGHAPT